MLHTGGPITGRAVSDMFLMDPPFGWFFFFALFGRGAAAFVRLSRRRIARFFF